MRLRQPWRFHPPTPSPTLLNDLSLEFLGLLGIACRTHPVSRVHSFPAEHRGDIEVRHACDLQGYVYEPVLSVDGLMSH